jgi:3-oxoacyl-[acyl-carrier-protein] synthase II
MRAALADAGVPPRLVDWVSAHATSTPLGDAAELRAIHDVFRANSSPTDALPVSSAKGHVGHLLGAAGGLEAVITTLALAKKIIPHTRGLHVPDDDAPKTLNLVRDTPLHPARLDLAISNSFGFGGINTSLLFAAPDAMDCLVAQGELQ